MGTYAGRFGPHNPDATYVAHGYAERLFDTGEVQLNYAASGDAATAGAAARSPARPSRGGATRPRWRCSPSTSRSSPSTCAARAAPRGRRAATRSTTWATTSCASSTASSAGRRSSAGCRRAACSSAWLSAYAQAGPGRRPPTTRTRRCSPPRSTPAAATSIRQGIGPMFALWSKYLGDQWSVGDWDGMVAAAPRELPAWLATLFAAWPATSRRRT